MMNDEVLLDDYTLTDLVYIFQLSSKVCTMIDAAISVNRSSPYSLLIDAFHVYNE